MKSMLRYIDITIVPFTCAFKYRHSSGILDGNTTSLKNIDARNYQARLNITLCNIRNYIRRRN